MIEFGGDNPEAAVLLGLDVDLEADREEAVKGWRMTGIRVL